MKLLISDRNNTAVVHGPAAGPLMGSAVFAGREREVFSFGIFQGETVRAHSRCQAGLFS